MITIGLTGGIASGKSTVSSELKKLAIPVFDADQVSRDCVAKGSRGLQLVVDALGADILSEDGSMDRAKVSQLVFHDKAALHKLEQVIHKIVWEEAEAFKAECAAKQVAIAVFDVPLLIECGWHKRVDKVWLVAVEPELQIVRAMKRSGMTRQEVIDRIQAQMSLDEKKKYADLVIDNSGALEETLAFVRNELQKLVEN